MLKKQCNNVSILLYASTKRTDPPQVLNRAKRHINKNRLGKNEEVWVVIDVDNRSKDKFDSLLIWADENEKHGVAISNPCFEYWLLLHFDGGDGIQNLNDCFARLKQHLPNFKKNNLAMNQIDNQLLEGAISNAKKRNQHCHDWHVDNHSTVYLLVERILSEEKKANK